MAALWDKLKWWKKPKMLEEGKDYHFIDFNNSDVTGVELLMPEFAGVLYHYHKAGVVEENGIARLSFGYTVIHSGEHDIDDLNSNEKFHTIMGDLLTQILMAKADDETRNNNSEKPDFF
jgi:hypothetical protein